MIPDNTIRPARGQANMLAKYAGPYWVIARIGEVNFRIKESADAPAKVVYHNRLKPYCKSQSVTIPEWVQKLCKTLQPVEKPKTKEVEEAPAPAVVAPPSKNELREDNDKDWESKAGQPKRRGRPRKRNHYVIHTEDDHGMSEEETDQSPIRTRSGRTVKVPKLD